MFGLSLIPRGGVNQYWSLLNIFTFKHIMESFIISHSKQEHIKRCTHVIILKRLHTSENSHEWMSPLLLYPIISNQESPNTIISSTQSTLHSFDPMFLSTYAPQLIICHMLKWITSLNLVQLVINMTLMHTLVVFSHLRTNIYPHMVLISLIPCYL